MNTSLVIGVLILGGLGIFLALLLRVRPDRRSSSGDSDGYIPGVTDGGFDAGHHHSDHCGHDGGHADAGGHGDCGGGDGGGSH